MRSIALTGLRGGALAGSAALAALLAAAPAGAADGPKRGGTLVVSMNADARSLEPGINRDSNSDAVVNNLFEGLVGYRTDLSVGPALARSWTISEDGRSYTFTLRDGVTFHNGDPLTAEAVKWSWERKSGQEGWLCARFFNGQAGGLKVEAVEAPDPKTVVFRLAEPSGLFLTQLANVQCGMLVTSPKSVGADGTWTPIGTGPFKFGSWKHGDQMVLERYDGYVPSSEPGSGFAGARQVYVDALRYQIIPDADAAAAALKTGAIDIIPQLDTIKIDELKAAGMKVMAAPGLNWSALLIQTEDPLLSNPKLRRALAQAIDIAQITEVRTNGLAKPNPSGVAESMRAFSADFLDWPKYDPAAAATLAKQAGYKGEPIRLQTNRRYVGMYDNAVMIQAMLSAAGFNVQLEVLDWAAQLDNYVNGRFQLSSFSYSGRFDPGLMYAALIADKATAKWAQWGDAQARELLAESGTLTDQTARAAIFRRLHAKMKEEVPIIGLYYSPTIEGVNPALHDYKPWAAAIPLAWGVWKG